MALRPIIEAAADVSILDICDRIVIKGFFFCKRFRSLLFIIAIANLINSFIFIVCASRRRNTKVGSSSGAGHESADASPSESSSRDIGDLDLALGIQLSKCFDLDRGESSSSAADELLSYRDRLVGIAKKRLSIAVDGWDHPTIIYFIKLFKPLGLKKEGLKVFGSYLRKVISTRSIKELEQLKQLTEQPSDSNGEVNFVACLANLLQDIVNSIEENNEILRYLDGENGILYSIYELQAECDYRGFDILDTFMRSRKLTLIELVSKIDSNDYDLSGQIDVYLQETISLAQLCENYTEEIESKIRSLGRRRDTGAARNGYFRKISLDLTTDCYVFFEYLYMLENVRKAAMIDERMPNSDISSMVGDVFFVVWVSCERAISTSNITWVIQVVKCAIFTLRGKYIDALLRPADERSNAGSRCVNEYSDAVLISLNEYIDAMLRYMDEHGDSVLRSLAHSGRQQEMGAEIATTLNDLEVSSEYALKLRSRIEEKCREAFPAPADIESVESCLSSLDVTSTRFKEDLDGKMEQLVDTLVSEIKPVLESVRTIGSDCVAMYEETNPWVKWLTDAIESNVACLKPLLTTANYEKLVCHFIRFIVTWLHDTIFTLKFSDSGLEQLPRDISELAGYLSSMTQSPIGDALDLEMEQLVATVTSRIEPILQSVKTMCCQEMCRDETESPWVQRLIHALVTNVAWVEQVMTATNYGILASRVAVFIVRSLVNVNTSLILSEGRHEGLQEDINQLTNHLSSMNQLPIQTALYVEREQLVASLTSQIEPVLEGLKTIDSDGKAIYGVANPWLQSLFNALAINEALLKPLMTTGDYDRFAHRIIVFIVRSLLNIIPSLGFGEGGREKLQRDMEELASHLPSMTTRDIRRQISALNYLARFAANKPPLVRRRLT